MGIEVRKTERIRGSDVKVGDDLSHPSTGVRHKVLSVYHGDRWIHIVSRTTYNTFLEDWDQGESAWRALPDDEFDRVVVPETEPHIVVDGDEDVWYRVGPDTYQILRHVDEERSLVRSDLQGLMNDFDVDYTRMVYTDTE